MTHHETPQQPSKTEQVDRTDMPEDWFCSWLEAIDSNREALEAVLTRIAEQYPELAESAENNSLLQVTVKESEVAVPNESGVTMLPIKTIDYVKYSFDAMTGQMNAVTDSDYADFDDIAPVTEFSYSTVITSDAVASMYPDLVTTELMFLHPLGGVALYERSYGHREKALFIDEDHIALMQGRTYHEQLLAAIEQARKNGEDQAENWQATNILQILDIGLKNGTGELEHFLKAGTITDADERDRGFPEGTKTLQLSMQSPQLSPEFEADMADMYRRINHGEELTGFDLAKLYGFSVSESGVLVYDDQRNRSVRSSDIGWEISDYLGDHKNLPDGLNSYNYSVYAKIHDALGDAATVGEQVRLLVEAIGDDHPFRDRHLERIFDFVPDDPEYKDSYDLFWTDQTVDPDLARLAMPPCMQLGNKSWMESTRPGFTLDYDKFAGELQASGLRDFHTRNIIKTLDEIRKYNSDFTLATLSCVLRTSEDELLRTYPSIAMSFSDN